jgi:DNA-binding PadR family transcriptional regulator
VARTGQTEMAVLGALSIQPMTGYALRDAIRTVLGHFWSESFGQIYPTLSGLARQGFVAKAATGAHAGTFTLTKAGRRRLAELLAEPVQTTPPRNGLLLRLFFGRTLGREACRELIRQARDDAQARLAELDRVSAEVDDETSADKPFIQLTISAGRHSARAAIAWADESLAALDRLDTP